MFVSVFIFENCILEKEECRNNEVNLMRFLMEHTTFVLQATCVFFYITSQHNYSVLLLKQGFFAIFCSNKGCFTQDNIHCSLKMKA